MAWADPDFKKQGITENLSSLHNPHISCFSNAGPLIAPTVDSGMTGISSPELAFNLLPLILHPPLPNIRYSLHIMIYNNGEYFILWGGGVSC